MTVPSSAERNNYTGDGSTETYAYSFRIILDSHLLVTVADVDGAETTLAKGTDYTVTGVGVKTGGNIVLVDNNQAWLDADGNLDTDWDLTVRHYVPLAQGYDIRNLGAYYPETHEDALDYLMWAVKQQQDELNRCVKSGETDLTPPSLADIDAAVSAANAAKVAAQLAETNAETAEVNAESAQAAAEAAAASIPAKASQAEAEAGTVDNVYMTPLKTAQAIAALAQGSATELSFVDGDLTAGILTITGDKTIVSLRNNSGYEIMPSDCYLSGGNTKIDLLAFGTLTGTWKVRYFDA